MFKSTMRFEGVTRRSISCIKDVVHTVISLNICVYSYRHRQSRNGNVTPPVLAHLKTRERNDSFHIKDFLLHSNITKLHFLRVLKPRLQNSKE